MGDRDEDFQCSGWGWGSGMADFMGKEVFGHLAGIHQDDTFLCLHVNLRLGFEAKKS